MTQSLNQIVFTGSPRRIRVLCTGPLAMGAFASTSFYGVTNPDGLGASPITVVAVFLIASNPNAFEVAVDSDLTAGAQYTVAVTALPFADSSTLTSSITAATAATANAPLLNAEPGASDFDLRLYSRDLVLTDAGDLGEDPTGDLLTTTGRPNWFGAMQRRVMSLGLPWQPSYSAKAGDYVNAPSVFALPLSAEAISQCRADDRTDTAVCTIIPDAAGSPGLYFFNLALTAKDGLDTQSFQVPIPLFISS